jgi:hypothetical protein
MKLIIKKTSLTDCQKCFEGNKKGALLNGNKGGTSWDKRVIKGLWGQSKLRPSWCQWRSYMENWEKNILRR